MPPTLDPDTRATRLLREAADAWFEENPHDHPPFDPGGRACCAHYSSAANSFLHAAEAAYLLAAHVEP